MGESPAGDAPSGEAPTSTTSRSRRSRPDEVGHLRGPKENVVTGRLISVGTGMEFYRKIKVPDER